MPLDVLPLEHIKPIPQNTNASRTTLHHNILQNPGLCSEAVVR